MTQDEVVCWLEEYSIKNYSLRDDLTVDVAGSVNISRKNLEVIPVQFGIVQIDFVCYENQLKSLKGSPSYVGRDFFCQKNLLESLEHSPSYVGSSYLCNFNKITNIKGCPKEIGDIFDCSDNAIVNIEFSPDVVMRNCAFDYHPHMYIWDFNAVFEEQLWILKCPVELPYFEYSSQIETLVIDYQNFLKVKELINLKYRLDTELRDKSQLHHTKI